MNTARAEQVLAEPCPEDAPVLTAEAREVQEDERAYGPLAAARIDDAGSGWALAWIEYAEVLERSER